MWLYLRFPLSFREVEELMLARGVVVTYETIRRWCAKFGPDYAAQLRRRRPRPGDKWHLDEVFVRRSTAGSSTCGARSTSTATCSTSLVQSRRNAVAAKRFFRKLLKGLRYVPRVIVTDKLASYQVAHRELMPSVQHRRSKYLNNRAENSHQPTRHRERAMKRFNAPLHISINVTECRFEAPTAKTTSVLAGNTSGPPLFPAAATTTQPLPPRPWVRARFSICRQVVFLQALGTTVTTHRRRRWPAHQSIPSARAYVSSRHKLWILVAMRYETSCTP